ncbi:divisome protein SepX/GlpR [Streptomyces sp. NPDC054933]
MSSSGLIYAAIVGAWAAYLVPMWLRRQDELNEARPTERFSTAIRLLSGRAGMERRYAKAREGGDPRADGAAPEPAPDTADRPVDVRSLALPATEVQPVEHTAERGGHPGHAESQQAAAAQRALLASNGRAKVLARRRRTTTVLFLAFTAGAIAAAVGGLAYLWAPAAPGVLLTLYIAHLRRAERRRFEFTMDQRRAAEAARRLRERPRERPRPEPTGAAAAGPAAPAAPEPSPRTADRRALVEQTDHAEWVDQQHNQATADDGWEPVPVPLPTYVTAPVAPRSTGSVDLGAPDTWSSARSGTAAEPDHPRPQPRRPRDRDRTPLFDQYAHGAPQDHADLDRPRAANE